ncbi:hemerythrin HHE cation binding domain protein [Anaerotignum neopropionicum]|uniref:Hemerythrin HHE cation binding domain protein n=1 Tax=Anaerotignum neopropionicum TaxID=36847 RepID=A0A136WEM3_9FIRM|nr:hemerythrin domain-containing protein [Anaerotignum neopropionicum]KXL52966.1 hemerythrin HHE cation binding domain protein [Anaerotignum neopropionicum]
MNSIDLMVQEHENILSLVAVIRNASCRILEGAPVEVNDFRDMITFARTYADQHHHGKEEQILFREMMERLGPAAVKLIQHGMFVEHDMGRFHLGELENALARYDSAPNIQDKLEILVNAGAWANLLQRHIDKENNVVYTFASRSLSDDIMLSIDGEVERFEEQAEKEGVQQIALKLLKQLTKKYC